MTAKIRKLANQFTSTHTTQFKNLLVSGCSFTYNNSEKHICSWPYYLRDIADFKQVYDCSQSGAGSNHIFNSIINEIETNNDITPDSTLVICMWSGLTRTDTIATRDITKPYHSMSNYDFDDKFSTLSIFNQSQEQDKSPVAEMSRQYKKIVDVNAQIYESCLKIIALDAYLKHTGFTSIHTSWQDPGPDLLQLTSGVKDLVKNKFDKIQFLGNYAKKNNLLEPCGHPTPDGYLAWTRECLVPFLVESNLATNPNTI
jgi:hypothetical protein